MLKKAAASFSIVGELLSFLWKEKIWWMVPLVSVLLVLGLLMMFAQGSAVAPFIYTLF